MLDSDELIFGGLAKLNAAGAEEWIQIYADGFDGHFSHLPDY